MLLCRLTIVVCRFNRANIVLTRRILARTQLSRLLRGGEHFQGCYRKDDCEYLAKNMVRQPGGQLGSNQDSGQGAHHNKDKDSRANLYFRIFPVPKRPEQRHWNHQSKGRSLGRFLLKCKERQKGKRGHNHDPASNTQSTACSTGKKAQQDKSPPVIRKLT